jgi:pantothenate kinase
VTDPLLASQSCLIKRARGLVEPGRRRILGITGAPGAGKSTLANKVVAALGADAVLVPMDGFHLANAELERLGRRDRKGAVDTFDAAGYAALLRRLRDGTESLVYAPLFRREIEEPIACAIPVPREMPLVVTEGNYLLVDSGGWAPVRGLLDEVWFLDPPAEVRLDRLVRRHQEFGKPPRQAWQWAHGTDQRNAVLVDSTRARADLVVCLTD